MGARACLLSSLLRTSRMACRELTTSTMCHMLLSAFVFAAAARVATFNQSGSRKVERQMMMLSPVLSHFKLVVLFGFKCNFPQGPTGLGVVCACMMNPDRSLLIPQHAVLSRSPATRPALLCGLKCTSSRSHLSALSPSISHPRCRVANVVPSLSAVAHFRRACSCLFPSINATAAQDSFFGGEPPLSQAVGYGERRARSSEKRHAQDAKRTS